MRTKIKKIASMFMIIIGLLLTGTYTQAQHERRRSNHNDENRHWSNHQDQRNTSHNYDQRNDDRNRYNNNYNQNNNTQFAHHRYYGYYDNSCRNNYGPPSWVNHRRMHPRARYIYFRDADVYYDCNRNTYITISGRNWSISTTLPQHMCRIDMGRVAYEDVDYNGDDVYQYHSQRYYNR